MNKDNPVSRLALSIALLVLLLPFYALVLLPREFGVVSVLVGLIREGRAFDSPMLYVLLSGYAASAVWIVCRGRLLGPVAMLLVTTVLHLFLGVADSGKRYELLIGGGRPVQEIDVYCNDVYLGKTPLRISESEFHRQVKPWDTPPAQPHLSISEEDDVNMRYNWAKYFYVPHDIFELYRSWPPDYQRYNRHDANETLEDIRSSKYWWHFEKDGCVGLTRLSNFGGGAGGGRTITIEVDPDIEFVSAEAHLELLLAYLENANYQASPEWVDHFLRFKGLLFIEFYQQVRRNDKLQPALHALLRAEFDIPETATEQDCARVVDEILSRAERAGSFTVPSLESLAIELVGRAHTGPIVRCFIISLRLGRAGSSGTRSSDNWTTYRRSGRSARLLPLEFAVRKVCPLELFNRIVYMSRNGQYLDIIGNYPRKEAVRLIEYHLRRIEREGGRRQRFNVDRATRLCANIQNPDLEQTLRNFIRQNAGAQRHDFGVREFIRSRIESVDANASGLAEWIFHWAPLDDREKTEYLVQINSPQTYHYVTSLIHRNSSRREEVIYQLEKQPNPSLDKFLIDAYEWYQSPQGPGYWSANLSSAVVNTDTPAMREFLRGLWNKGGKDRKTLLRHLRGREWHKPHMNWLTPLIAELTAKDERLLAAQLLSKIDTGDTWRLAEEWARDPDPEIAAASRDQLQIRRQRLDLIQEQLEQAKDLIAGKIEPDGLLPARSAYAWNGREYVPKVKDN